MVNKEQLQQNINKIKSSIQVSALRCGRSPEEIKLLAVTKTVDSDTCKALFELGLKRQGENRTQIAIKKATEIQSCAIDWHFIGHLQRNKVKSILPIFQTLHSLDSERLALEIQKEAAEANLNISVFIEVNTSKEESKYGLTPAAAFTLADKVVMLPNIKLLGLMTMAPFVADPEEARPCFRELSHLQQEMGDKLGQSLPEISMGMSNDFTIAVEEGATVLRIGSALFTEN